MKYLTASSLIAMMSALMAASATEAATSMTWCWRRPFGLNPNERATWALLPGVSMTRALGLTKAKRQIYCSDHNVTVDVYRATDVSALGIMCLTKPEEQVLRCGAAGPCCTASQFSSKLLAEDKTDILFNAEGVPLPQEEVLATLKVEVDKLNATIIAKQNANTIAQNTTTVAADGTSTTTNTTSLPQYMVPSKLFLEYGSCGFPVDFNNSTVPVVALNKEDFGGLFRTASCNECVEIKYKDREPLVARVASMCDIGCEPGKLQLSEKHAYEMEPNLMLIRNTTVTYTKVACPVTHLDAYPIVKF